MIGIKQALFDVSDSKRNEFWSGRALRANQWASAIYLLIAFGPLIAFAWWHCPAKLDFATLPRIDRLLLLLLGVIVSAGPPAWFWLEARAFDDWANAKSDATAKQLRETFKLNADGERAFWAAIVAVYAAVLLKF
jgi:hypothetical protein